MHMWNYNNTIQTDELYHYGVLGMKWGKRKGSASLNAARNRLKSAKAEKKQAYRSYSKAFNKSSTLIGAYGKNRNKNANDTYKKALESNKANSEYKKAKVKYKQELNKHNRRYSKAAMENDKRVYGKSGVKRINQRMNKGSSYTGAALRETGRQFAISQLGIGGAILAANLVKKDGPKKVGRSVVNAILKASGHRDITWLD